MSTIRPMKALDLLNLAPVNLDVLTETYNIGFYLEYLAKWPHMCHIIESKKGDIEGYSTHYTHLLKLLEQNELCMNEKA